MIRVELGEEVRPGVWAWQAGGLEGRSRQPLLDACRAIRSIPDAPLSQEIGLFREGRDSPDLFCTVGVGAELTVEEAGPRFIKWKPFKWQNPRLTPD
jgi:hypothetical protein